MTTLTSDSYEQLLLTLPPENILTKDDPAYPQAEAFGGCLTCANGEPCQTLIDNDVHEILKAAGLPESEQLACLQWMIAGDYSSLTHSRDEMVAELLAALIFVLEANGNDLLVLPYDPTCSQLALFNVMAEEAARLETPLSDVNLRLVIKTENSAQPDAAMANAA